MTDAAGGGKARGFSDLRAVAPDGELVETLDMRQVAIEDDGTHVVRVTVAKGGAVHQVDVRFTDDEWRAAR